MDRAAYTVHRIPKQCGGWREILEPNPALKAEQRAILAWLMARRLSPGPYAHAFIRRRSIITHAKPHVGKRVIVCMDIANFFTTIETAMIRHALVREGLRLRDADYLTNVCTVDGSLPQGAPTSPFLANLVFKPLDYRLAGLARAFTHDDRTSYTRYADDLVFSSNNRDLHRIVHPARKLLLEAGFKLNPRKTRVHRNGNRQVITGLVVNRHLNVPRNERRRLRAYLHRLRTASLEGLRPEMPWQSLYGTAAYYHQVDPDLGRRIKHEIRHLEDLSRLATSRSGDATASQTPTPAPKRR